VTGIYRARVGDVWRTMFCLREPVYKRGAQQPSCWGNRDMLCNLIVQKNVVYVGLAVGGWFCYCLSSWLVRFVPPLMICRSFRNVRNVRKRCWDRRPGEMWKIS